MRKPHPTVIVGLLSAGLLVHASDLATPVAQAGPLRKAAAAARAAGRGIAHAIPGHARRVARRHNRMIGQYYGPPPNQPIVQSQPIGQIISTPEEALSYTPAPCPGGICPYNQLPVARQP